MPPTKRDYNFPTTIGAEYEGVGVPTDVMNSRIPPEIRSMVLEVSRDASVESPVLLTNGGSIKLYVSDPVLRNRILHTDVAVLGYELVTNPLSFAQMCRLGGTILNLQSDYGEALSERGSIHLHVGFPREFAFQKNALAMAMAFEPFLFKIAGLGRRYRGDANHSTYCRPIALPPAVLLHNEEGFALPSPKEALETGDRNLFWVLLGAEPGTSSRYVAARYYGVNVYSSVLRQTLEFRFFNMTDSSRYLRAIYRLAQFLGELCMRGTVKSFLDQKSVSIFQKNPDSAYIRLLESFLSYGRELGCTLKLKGEHVATLAEIVEKTPQPVFNETDVIATHLRKPYIHLKTAEDAGMKILGNDEVILPEFVDIHNFGDGNVEFLKD